jgi:prepilin-type N-terminal cleavage/methylation domain-containing protein
MPPTRSRGFTLIELLIVVAVLGCIAALALYFGASLIKGGSPTLFGSDAPARAWAEELKYSFVAASCTNSPADGGYVRCSVRVEEKQDPIALECGIASKRCSIMRASGQ